MLEKLFFCFTFIFGVYAGLGILFVVLIGELFLFEMYIISMIAGLFIIVILLVLNLKRGL